MWPPFAPTTGQTSIGNTVHAKSVATDRLQPGLHVHATHTAYERTFEIHTIGPDGMLFSSPFPIVLLIFVPGNGSTTLTLHSKF